MDISFLALDVGNMFSSIPIMNTTGNSSPLALCSVIRATAPFPSFMESMSDTRETFSKNAISASSPSERSFSISLILPINSRRLSMRDSTSPLLSSALR